MTKYILIIVLTIPLIVNSQTTKTEVAEKISKRDTIVIVRQIPDENVLKHYHEILEKTNSQLSLWWNPFGVFVAMLGVLFTILTIVAAFVIYRQSKEHKELIQKSLEEHQVALDKLIIEKNNQLKIYDANLDKSINEYREKLNNESNENKEKIEEFIKKLEEQKEFVDIQTHTYRHSGWEAKDIPENYAINLNSNFYGRIVLSEIGQSFAIYIRIVTTDNKQLWLGFAGNNGNTTPFKSRDEFTSQQTFNEKEITINENIINYFRQGFPDYKTQPVKVINVRLRASNDNRKDISYSYKIT